MSRRGIVIGLGVAAFWIAFFHRVAPGTIANELQTAFAVSGATLGALAATYFYVYALMQLPTGVLVDTLGPRKVLTAGGVIAGIGSMMFGMADGVVAAAIGRTLAGLGVSVAFVSALKLNAAWFSERHFATTASITNVVGLTGALAATVPLAWLVLQVSWRTVFVVIGAASFVIALLTWWVMRDRPVSSAHKARDQDQGSDSALAADHGMRWHRGLADVVRNRATWTGFWMSFGLSGSYMSFIGLWGVPMLVHGYGLPLVEASHHAAAILIALAVSSVFISTLSDRIRRRRPVAIAVAALYCAVWVPWVIGVPREWTWVMFVLTGLCAPGFVLSWVYAKEMNRPRYAGMGTSVANTGGFLAAGILQPLVGWVLDRASNGGAYTITSFRFALAVLMLFAVIGFIATLFMRETHCRNIWEEKTAKEYRA
ncbi:MAG: MFS transporter [Burkholderiales bacterium]